MHYCRRMIDKSLAGRVWARAKLNYDLRAFAPLREIILLLFFLSPVLSTAQAADQIVVDSALLRLTHQIEVPARAQGVLSSMGVVEGDSVKKGSVLAQVDAAEAQLLQDRAAMELELQREKVKNDVAIRTAQKALAFHRDEAKRLEDAVRGLPGSISKSEILELQFKAAQAELELEQAQYELRADQHTVGLKNKELELSQHNVEVRKISAPIDGVVVEVLRQPGEWVEPGEKVLRIVTIDKLRAEGLVHVRQLPPKLVGAPVSLAVDLPGRGETTFAGKVIFVSPEINPVNGQARVWAEIDNRQGLLRPGLRPRMTIQLPAVANRAETAQRQPTR
jgi:multidrug efflux pump subunit AcrA (membrane-fusion protein)